MMKSGFAIFCLLALGLSSLSAGLMTKEITYKSGDTELKGYLAWDDAIKGERPGVLVVHEWWGHNDYARKRAEMLAELGYVGMAIDMYGNGKQAHHPKDAGTFAGEALANLEVAENRFKAAIKVLQKEKTTDADQIAAIGYCFGGGVVLHAARAGMDLDGVVSFHGSLSPKEGTMAKEGEIKADVLVLNGADDSFVSQESIDALKAEMAAAKADFEFVNYEGAVHGFTNPDATAKGEQFGIPLAYNEAADKASWAKMQEFLKEIFAK